MALRAVPRGAAPHARPSARDGRPSPRLATSRRCDLIEFAGGSTGPGFAVYIDQSPDLDIWYDAASSLAGGTPTTVEFRTEWIRVRSVVSSGGSGDPGVTCWCVGDFVRRHA